MKSVGMAEEKLNGKVIERPDHIWSQWCEVHHPLRWGSPPFQSHPVPIWKNQVFVLQAPEDLYRVSLLLRTVLWRSCSIPLCSFPSPHRSNPNLQSDHARIFQELSELCIHRVYVHLFPAVHKDLPDPWSQHITLRMVGSSITAYLRERRAMRV